VCLYLELYFSAFAYQDKVVLYVLISSSIVLSIKTFSIIFFKKIQSLYGGNSRTVVLGSDKTLIR
jgi:hypothetical protein